MIELGLARIARLLAPAGPLPWRAIHVAGTNGKGSICAAASAMLQAQGVSHGRFTSPHLVERWDCINIDAQPVAEALFLDAEAHVLRRNERDRIGATEFELLTATAFELFTRARVAVAVIETGLGGRLDATNVLESPLVTVIANIGLDHQALLGDSLEAIAAEKAGILKPGCPVVLDAANPPEVLRVVRARAAQIHAGPVVEVAALPPVPVPADNNHDYSYYRSFLAARPYAPHELRNLALAYRATLLALSALPHPIVPNPPLSLFRNLSPSSTVLPGRLQPICLQAIAPHRTAPALLDGAHNADSAAALAAHVDAHLRPTSPSGSVTWLLASSRRGALLTPLLAPLLRPADRVVAVQFGAVAGMPWVRATPGEEILVAAEAAAGDKAGSLSQTIDSGADVAAAVRTAAELAGEAGPLVVAGSLYLVGEVVGLLRKGEEGG
ncbi:uncharacterized protein K452DRAFT_326303 [Aplosporella prunicola CBS 121167]|uniref:Dihydrofolate synthetase n=1 Tax=Aplosporella prunicola CBS 121167 TaxID=1176127 RepID=A0A6A6BGG8_9PEZI|nr:uncharacterized protein K452DRAFT_326303 [Aplosporella prunicola CBS 121167]KAF2142364.1 hypothetical protein K452DRAFT_326303 [Aplosporella prunicola CBS 121167]